MKRILALVLLAVLFSANAFAQAVDNAGNRITATFGDQDTSAQKSYRVTADTTGLVQFDNGTSIAWPFEQIDTANTGQGAYTFTSLDSGLFVEDFGGNALTVSAPGKLTGKGVVTTLPACVTATLGFKFEVVAAVRENVTLTPSTTADSIDYSISGTGLNAGQGLKTTSTQAGDGIGVMCIAPGQWQVTKATGTIASAP